MESGLPMLNCLLQHTLRNLCACSASSSNSPKWAYAVFWKILPRNYPPPRWEYGGNALDRSKGNKRNWIMVWEDGFCDFLECERARSFGPGVFFKMSHEVYNYGEGLVGKVAADNSHKWVFRESLNENESSFISSWSASIEPQPRAWELQFNSGIQTIAIISVREGLVQLGSLNKVVEDLNLVITIQRKFSYLHTVPGVFTIHRPYPSIQHPYIIKPIEPQEPITGTKRLLDNQYNDAPIKCLNLGWNTPTSGNVAWSIPPLLPNMSCSLGALLSKLPSVGAPESNEAQIAEVKTEEDAGEECKETFVNQLSYGPLREEERRLNLY